MSKKDSIYLVLQNRLKRAARAAAAKKGLTVARYITELIVKDCRETGADDFVGREKEEGVRREK